LSIDAFVNSTADDVSMIDKRYAQLKRLNERSSGVNSTAPLLSSFSCPKSAEIFSNNININFNSNNNGKKTDGLTLVNDREASHCAGT